MTYPTDNPTFKHDLCVVVQHDDQLPHAADTPRIFTSCSELLDHSSQNPKNRQLLCPVYTYPDAPSPPLGRILLLIGLVPAGDLIAKLRNLLHECTVAVKRLSQRLVNKVDIQNSTRFSKLSRHMRREGLLAVFSCDNNRLGILEPIVGEDFAVNCYIGKQAVLKPVLVCVGASSENEKVRDAIGGENKDHSATSDTNAKRRRVVQNRSPVPEISTSDAEKEANQVSSEQQIVLSIGGGHCHLTFDRSTAWRLFHSDGSGMENCFGLRYKFKLEEGSNHEAGVGDAVNADEWLAPLPVLVELAKQAGLELEYAQNFHEFYAERNGSPATEGSMKIMNVLNQQGSISQDEWDIARLYIALKFRKKEASRIVIDKDEDISPDSTGEEADDFYSELQRNIDTRADSLLFHLRNFNGWIKDTLIKELAPRTSVTRGNPKGPLRVLDLACGKGGDLGKWVRRGLSNYVGADIARGSLHDAALRARKIMKGKRCTFIHADLGSDVPGRPHTSGAPLQNLLSWSLEWERGLVPTKPSFRQVRGGGIQLHENFDVVSIQFALHYMMSSERRAKRFFHTVSELLELNGNLIATTVDARVVVDKLMEDGVNFHK